MHPDWLNTGVRVIRQLSTLANHVRPTLHARDVREIDPDELCRQGIRGVLWDVDGTLMGYHAHEIAPDLRAHVHALFADDRLRHAIVSNCDDARLEELARIFPEATVVRLHQTEPGLVTRSIANGVERYEPPLSAPLPPGATAVQKPSAALVEAAAAALGDVPLAQIVVVGDQYFTDVASASLAGARSIKVTTYQRRSFPVGIQLGQGLERAFAWLLNAGRRQPT